MPEQSHTLILDTHVWVWLLEGSTRLRPAVRNQIEKGALNGQLRLSAISVWEVAMLEAKGRITFDEDCSVWVQNALSARGLSLMPLTPEISIAATRLPGTFHGDPADRLIVATARSCGGTLVTADKGILDYGSTGLLRILPASVRRQRKM